MKKYLPYVIIAIVLLVAGLLILGSRSHQARKWDERITMRQKDQIPYGTAAARSLLPQLFPGTEIFVEDHSPGTWANLSTTENNQAVIFTSTFFNADEEELNQLLSFVRRGNYVFIIGRSFSPEAERFFNFNNSDHSFGNYFVADQDSLRIRLDTPALASAHLYEYPGKKYSNSFSDLDTAHTQVLGRNENGWPDFIAFRAGQGRIFIHAAPLAFSNYFILHRDNIRYFQSTLSVIPKDIRRLVWDEYYLNKPLHSRESQPGIFHVLMKYAAFSWGLLTFLIFLLLFLLLGSRRRQRKIAPHARPANDSLDFVKTLGRLYHDRRDHSNLARKMAVYFLEHVRTSYRLPTHTLDDEFVKALYYKSGYSEGQLAAIIHFIRALDEGADITQEQLANFHTQLELFYQNT